MAVNLEDLIKQVAGGSTGTPVAVKVASGEASSAKSQSGF